MARAVGWNWVNSMSCSAAPARQAMATPSPVATGGLVVSANTWPAPPVASSVARASTSVAVPSSSRKRHPITRPVAGHEVDRAREGKDADGGRAAGLVQQRPDHLPARRVAESVEDAVPRVRAFAGEVEPAGLAIEARAPGGELADPLRAFLHQHARRRLGDEPRAGLEGVVEVQLGGVVHGHRDRDPALRVAGVALGRLVLGDDEHLAVTGEGQRRPEARDAGPEHEEVGADDRIGSSHEAIDST